MEIDAKVTTGTTDWLVVSLNRQSEGIEIFVRTDPRVEAFMASLSEGGQSDPLEMHGRSWEAKGTPVRVYRIEKDIVYDGFQLGKVCTPLFDRHGNVNLSFLQFVGTSKEGVRFVVPGPFPSDFVKIKLKDEIETSARKFFKQYIVPLKIRLRIIGEEVR